MNILVNGHDIKNLSRVSWILVEPKMYLDKGESVLDPDRKSGDDAPDTPDAPDTCLLSLHVVPGSSVFHVSLLTLLRMLHCS